MRDRFKIDGQKMAQHPARVARWLEAKDDWEKAKAIYPIYVEIGPVSYCNHECTFCGVDYMLDRPEKPMIEEPVMRQTLSDMAAHGVLSVMFAGAGEPMLYKPLARMIRHANDVGIDTSITTNAVLLTEKFCREAFPAQRLRWIKASVNAGDAATYAQIHRTKPEDFETVLRNLEAAVKVRRELGSSCTIGAQTVALPEVEKPNKRSLLERHPSNIRTIVPLAKRLRDIGVDYLVVKPYSQHLMSTDTRVYEDVTYKDANAWVEEAQAVSTDTFNVVVRSETMAHWDAEERGYEKCHATPYHWAYIEADGEVWGCSAYLGRVENGTQYGDDRFRYGNIKEASFSAIWEGERRKANWEFVRTQLDIKDCRRNCRMHQVNVYLNSLVEPNPHVNFI